MSLKEIDEEILNLKMLFVDTSRLETEYFRKITWSFSPLIFILLGFPLAVITNKRTKSANVILAMMAVTVYYVLSLGCEALSMENIAPAWIIMWGPNLLGAIMAIWLNWKICHS